MTGRVVHGVRVLHGGEGPSAGSTKQAGGRRGQLPLGPCMACWLLGSLACARLDWAKVCCFGPVKRILEKA